MSNVDVSPTRRRHSLELFAAIKDSIYYPEPAKESNNANTERSRVARLRISDETRAEARQWIRAAELTADDSGHGFGFLWESMVALGSVFVPIEEFIEKMEAIWEKVDEDHSVGTRLITLLKGMQCPGNDRAAGIRSVRISELLRDAA